jgi:multidrug efflux pump subunit AcrB
MNATTHLQRASFSSRVVGFFLQGPWPLLITIVCLLAGAVSLALTPREEEPQIVVPTADLLIRAPGLSNSQVERQVTTRVEKLLSQIDGVEYVHSVSRDEGCLVTVRFYVGEDREDSLVKIYNKLLSNTDAIPSEVESWVVKPVEIDDVPIVVATLWSTDPERISHYELRRLAEEFELELGSVPDTGRVTIIGGTAREVRVDLDPEALAARRTTALDVAFALDVSSLQQRAGRLDRAGRSLVVDAGSLVASVADLDELVVNVVDGLPVYLREVATVRDGPGEPESWTWLAQGPAASGDSSIGLADPFHPAVQLAVAKQKGTNAVRVAEDVLELLEDLKEQLMPPEAQISITRNYGETAREKVDELVEALAVAVLTVVLFVGLVLGFRAGLVIALAIPVCYGATLLINYLFGYTINRVTLFALILALGLIVDDPITDVENIERVLKQGRLKARDAVLFAVQEVRPALIMSTIAIILTFLPLFFITGMMGPYMEPMALNVPLAVSISTVVAFCVTPYLALKLVRAPREGAGDADPDAALRNTLRYRWFDRALRPLISSPRRAWMFLAVVMVLFIAALTLPALRLVPLKMLPFDNKNELQVTVHMPEGTTLEATDGTLRELAQVILQAPEVESIASHAGVYSPMDFNGMVRRYYLRGAPHTGDLRVQLVHKDGREDPSHALALRWRAELEEVAERNGARIQIVEVPPGPPVLSTITVEIYGDRGVPYTEIEAAALAVAARLEREPLVVDVDTSVESPQDRVRYVVDKEKAALSGIATEDVVRTLDLALDGLIAAQLEAPREVNPLPIVLRLERAQRSDPTTISLLQVQGRPGIVKQREAGGVQDAPRPLVALGELGRLESSPVMSPVYHKNLRPVAFVYAELSGRPPADAILDIQADQVADGSLATPSAARGLTDLRGRTHISPGGGDPWSLPAGTSAVWNGEGEWQVTLDVFRDLGIAFGAANIAIFLVLWLQTSSVIVTLILMAAIPLTMIGIMPGFWLLNSLGARDVAGLPDPVFFTATAMIGMIALSGIVVRNSLVLVDFVHSALREGMPLDEALVRSCAIRVRPILLTAGTTLLGNLVITLDPVFSGLAWAIIFGILASSLFSLGVVPVIYHLVYARKPGHGLPVRAEDTQ